MFKTPDGAEVAGANRPKPKLVLAFAAFLVQSKEGRMNRKATPFKADPDAVDTATIWVHDSNDERASNAYENRNQSLPAQGEIMKRFTIDVSEDLHKRIKAQCAMRGAKMADVMREILEHEFPKG